ncbi:TPA: DUF559 domain-containing protein [Stenotrophomonas maltophilia]|nr:DUF559 domain-containing protein [Stenotrophomonas maltophilia]HDX0806463.1 DUF559 domain-containing protein [Stenotrophomonas maltophilia]HDX0820105.1 DUF559 domain-containing protein [Stenotrophomonas maltophilia]HDX0833875.1 DUF559 domain-containing protein [Stenotrophomonas maltophilia]HDX0854424.1 DUF559 domain-containing protein [Stenotrophomonas maltophilia]
MKKDGWRDWLIANASSEKSESPMEALYAAAFQLLRERLNVPRPPTVILAEQAQVGPYRVDFLFSCKAQDGSVKRLVVEIDGHDFHDRTKEQASKDRSRDRWMTERGYVVIRFTGSDVWNDPFSCAEQTSDHIHQFVHGVSRREARVAAAMASMNALFEKED